MAAALASPPKSKPQPAAPIRWTVAEFHEMGKLGLLVGRRAILLDGTIVEQGPMDAPHANGVERTDAVIRAAFGPGWRFRIQLPLVLNAYTDPMPDIAVIPGTLSGSPNHPTSAALVIEIADTTLQLDLTDRAEQYATAGVEDYWVLDLNGNRLIVFRDPGPLPAVLGATAYRTQQIFLPADRVAPLALPNASILVSDMLP